MKRKILVFLSALAVILGCSCFAIPKNNIATSMAAIGGDQVIIDDGSSDDTSATVINIYSPYAYKTVVAEINAAYERDEDLSDYTGKIIRLQASIDLSTETDLSAYIIKKFVGTFDGQFYTVKGLPMFCEWNFGTIQRVCFEQSENTSYYAYEYYTRAANPDIALQWYGAGVVAGINYDTITACSVNKSTIRINSAIIDDIRSYEHKGTKGAHGMAVGGIAGINCATIEACGVYESNILTSPSKTFSNSDGKELNMENCAGGICGYLGRLGGYVTSSKKMVVDGCISVGNKLRAAGCYVLNSNDYWSNAFPESDTSCGAIFGQYVWSFVNQSVLLGSYPHYLTAFKSDSLELIEVKNCMSKGNVYYSSTSTKIETIGNFLRQLAYIWEQTSYDMAKDFMLYNNYHDNEITTYINTDAAIRNGSYTLLGDYLIEFLKQNSTDVSKFESLKVCWIDHVPFWFSSSNIPYSVINGIGESWWYSKGEYVLGNYSIDIYTTDGSKSEKFITLSSMDNYIIDKDRSGFSNWLFPEITDDHCGFPYYCKEVKVSIYHHLGGSSYSQYSRGDLKVAKSNVNYDDLQSTLADVFKNEKTIVIGDTLCVLTGFAARVPGQTREGVSNIADVDTCKVATDDYTRSKANYYSEVIPIYELVSLDVKFNLSTTNVSKDSISLNIGYVKSSNSTITKTAYSGTPAEFPSYVTDSTSTQLSFAMNFNLNLVSGDNFDKSYYYVYAEVTSGNTTFGKLSGDFAEKMKIESLLGHSAKGTKSLTFSLSGDISSSTTKTYEYIVTLTVYKKVELVIAKSNTISELGDWDAINDRATSDVDWSSVSDDFFSYYVLEGTNLIWCQDTSGYKYYNTSEKTYKSVFGSSTAALYYNNTAVLSSKGEIKESSDGNWLFNSSGYFQGYSGSVNQPYYILYGMPTAINQNIEYTLNFVQTGDFMDIGDKSNPTKNNATATINYIQIDAWTHEADDAGSDASRYYLTTGGVLSYYKPYDYGYEFTTGQSITFEINVKDYASPRVILKVGGVSKINAELGMSNDGDILYNVGSINIGISIRQDWSCTDESISGRKMLTTIIGSENLTDIEESSITTAQYDGADEYYYATKNIIASFDDSATAYLHIAEIINITLDNSAVSGEANQTVYAINGTTLDTANDVTVPTGMEYYYYYTDDSGTTYANDQTNEAFTCKNGKLTVVDDDGMNDMHFYRIDEGGYYADYPNITVKGVKTQAQSAAVYFHYYNLNKTAEQAATMLQEDWEDLEEDGEKKVEFYKSDIGTLKEFNIDSYITASSGYTYYKSDSSHPKYIVVDSANAKFTIYWNGTSSSTAITDISGVLNIHVYYVLAPASVSVTYNVVDNATGDIRAYDVVQYTTAYEQKITTDFVYDIIGATSGINKITGLEKGATTNNCISYVGSETTPETDSDPGETYLVVKINSVTKNSTAIITIYVDFETTTTETSNEYTYQYKFEIYVNGELKGTDVFKVPYTYTDTTVTLGTPTVTNGSPSGKGYYYSSGSTRQYTIKHSNWGTYSSCTNSNTYSKLDCNGSGTYFDANIVDPTVAEIKSAASNNPTITISVYYTVETTFTLTLIPCYSGTSTEISSGDITRKQITLTKDDVGKTFAVFASRGNIKDNVTCYPTEFTSGGQLYQWYKLSTSSNVITINNTNTLLDTLYGNSFTYNSHSSSVTSGTVYVYYKQVYKLTLTAYIINYGSVSVNSPITKVVYSSESWDVSISDIYEDGRSTIYKVEYPNNTASGMSYTIDGTTITAKTLTENKDEDVYIYIYASEEEYGEATIRVTYKYYTDDEWTQSKAKNITVAGLTNPYEVTYAADCDSEVTIDSIETPKLTGYTYESYEIVSDECSLFQDCDEDKISFNDLMRDTYGFVDICVYYIPELFNLQINIHVKESDSDGNITETGETLFNGKILYSQLGSRLYYNYYNEDDIHYTPSAGYKFSVDDELNNYFTINSTLNYDDCSIAITLKAFPGEDQVIDLYYEQNILVLTVNYQDASGNSLGSPSSKKYGFEYRSSSDEESDVDISYGDELKNIITLPTISGYTFSNFANGVGLVDFFNGDYAVNILNSVSGLHEASVTAVYQSTLPTVTEYISYDDGNTKTQVTTHTNISSGTTFTATSIDGYQFTGWVYDSSAFSLSGNTLTLTATPGSYTITKKYKPISEYVAKITFNVHIKHGETATQSTSQKVTSTYGLTPNPFQNVGATAINQDVTGTYDYQYLMGKNPTINLKDYVNVNFGDRAKLKSTKNVPNGMTFSNIGTTFDNTQVTITSAVTSDVTVEVYYNIDSTDVTYKIVRIVDGVETDESVDEEGSDIYDEYSYNYLKLPTSQYILEYGVTGCDVSVSYTYSDGASVFLPADDTDNKQLTTPKSLNIAGLSGDYTITITLTYTTSTATITFKAQGPGLEQDVTKHIYYNGYEGWGRNDNKADILNPNTSYSASDIFGTIANYTFTSWGKLSDNADSFFKIVDSNLWTLSEYTNPTPTATVIANYTPVAVTMTFIIKCGDNPLKEETIAYYYHIGCLSSNPTNVQEIGYKDGLKNNVLTMYEDYGDYYCFQKWSIDTTDYGIISSSGKTLTLNTADENETWSDFTVTATYRKAKVTIVLNHVYTDDTSNTTNTYDYYYYINKLCVTNTFDSVGNCDNFNIDQDEGTIYFNDRHTGKRNNADDYATTVWAFDNNDYGIVAEVNYGENQHLQLSTLDEFVTDHTITVTATHTAQRVKVYVYDESDTSTPIEFTINGDKTKIYNPYEHYYRSASEITIDNPEKSNSTFIGWEVITDTANLVTLSSNNTTAKVSTSNNYLGEKEIKLKALFKSNDEYTCKLNVKLVDENGTEMGTNTLTFHYKKTGTVTTSDVYLGSTLLDPTLTDYVFLGWKDGDTNVFTSATSGIIKGKAEDVTGVDNNSTIEITAEFHSAVAKIIVTNKYNGTVIGEPTTLNFHYTISGTSTSGDVYLNSALPETQIAGYKFESWSNGDTRVFTSATSGKIKEKAEDVTGVDYNSTIEITANYKLDESSVSITFIGYVYRDSVGNGEPVETGKIEGVYYYNQKDGGNYHNGQEVTAESLIGEFDFATTQTLKFAKWGDGTSDSSITLTGTSPITIEVYYTYDATYTATFNIYYKYRENSGDSTPTELKTKEYSFGETTSNPLWNDEIVNKSEFADYGEFKGWEIIRQTGADDYKSWFTQNKDNITTGSERPTLTAEEYVINIYAILEVNKASVTINYNNQSNNQAIKEAENYEIYYNGNTRLDSEVATLNSNEMVYSNITGYAFQNWESESGNFSTFFEIVDNDLKVKDMSKLNLKGIITIDITANYLPDDYTTIIVNETHDGELQTSETYTFHYNATSVTGNGNLKVNDQITADATSGLTFVGWDLGENTDYFTLSGNNLILKKPTNAKTEITITKKYVSNRVSITYNRHYQNIDGTYTTDTSIYSYDYSSNTLAIATGSNCSKQSGSKWILINATTFNAYENYVLAKTQVVNEDGTTYTDMSGLSSKFVEYDGELYIYNKGGVTSGGYTITVDRTYNRPEAVLYTKLNLLDENGNQETTIDWTITPKVTYIDQYAIDSIPYLIYYYQNDGGYQFPTSYESTTHNYNFVKWEVSKSYGDDNWGAMFAEGGMSSYATLTTQQTDKLNSLYVLTLTATFKKVVNKCEITVEYVDENGDATQNNTNPTTYTLYYDKTDTPNGNILYNESTLTGSTIYGYTFNKWEIIKQDKSFMTITGNEITFSQPSDAKGGYSAKIKAYYTRNYTTINLYCVDTNNKSLQSASYTFYYGITDTNTSSDLFKGSTIAAPTITEYKFEEWATSGDIQFAGNTANPMTLNSPESATDNYTLNLTAKYSKSTCTIHIDYKSNDNITLLGTEDYEFHYTTTGTMTNKDIYCGNTISPKTFTGYTFASWDYSSTYFTQSDNDLNVKSSISTTPSDAINVTAYYVEDIIKIVISHVDIHNNTISDDRVVRYYYNGTSKLDGMTYDADDDSKNIIASTVIENYNFESWNTTSSYLTLSSNNQVLKINKITDLTGEWTVNVTARYKAQSECYYEFTINYVHYESEYYNGTNAQIGSMTYRYYYYSNKLTRVLKEEDEVDSVTDETIDNYNFLGYKNFDTQNIASGFQINNLLTLSGSNAIKLFNKDKLSEFSFDAYKTASSNSTNSKYDYVSGFIAKFTFANALAVKDISSQTNIVELDGKSFEVTAYYSKSIQIYDGWITNITTQSVTKIPVNYKINNQNFLNGVYDETLIDETVKEGTTTGEFTWTGQDQRLLYSSIKEGLDPDLTIYIGQDHKDYELSFAVDVGSLRPSNADEKYHPQQYHFVGWGETLPSWKNYIVSNPSKYTYPYVAETSELHSTAQSGIISYLNNLTYTSGVMSVEWGGNPFDIYMQWEADEHIITIYRDGQKNNETAQEYLYLSYGGTKGTVINDLTNSLIKDAEYIAEMKKRIGDIDGWEVAEMSNDSQILDVNGNALEVGSVIYDKCLYAGTYGKFALKPHFSSYTNLTVKFDYGTSVAGVGTLDSIYNNTTGSNNVFEYNGKYQYNEEFKLADILNNKFKDPTPLSTTYNGIKYYLAGWSTQNIKFNPENWAGIDSNTYIKLLKSLSNTASDVSFKRDCMDYEQATDGIYILSYDTASFVHLTGDTQSTIRLYAVWLPYYEININTNPMGKTATENTFLYVDKTRQTNNATISYGVSLTNQAINFYYDIRTSYGATPKDDGYSLALEGSVLSALDIIYVSGSTYYYQSSNDINRWLTSKASYQNWTYSGYTRTFSISTMMTGFVSNIVNENQASVRTVNIYPVWKDAEIKVDVEGKTKTQSTDVKLLGEYTLNAEQTNYYSIDYLTTDSNKKLNYLYGVDFIKFLKFTNPAYGDNVLGDVEVVNINKSQYLHLKLTAHYVGDLYFLRINSIEYNGTKNDNDNKLRCDTAIVFDDEARNYLIYNISNGVMSTRTSTMPKLSAIKKVTTKTNQMFSDYSTIYENWKYKIILNNDGYYYLAVVYGDNVYDQKSPYSLLWQQVERSDGSELEYYLYNDKYAYDVFDTTIARNDEYSISVNSNGKRVFKTSGITCPNDWKYEDVGTIYAVWRVKKYHVDLSTAFDNGSKIYSNSAYLVAQAVDYNATQDSDKYKYYVLNFEYNSTTSGYQFVLYTMTKSQFASKNRWYGGWDTLGLSGIKDTTDNKNSRITVTYGTELTIWVYDQSKDTNDKLVGYRLNSVDIRQQGETNATNFKVKSTGYLTCKDISGGDKNYVTTNAYTTVFDFREVALDNNYTIKYQAITEYIKYALNVEADSTTGGVVVRQNGKETATMSKYQFTGLTLGDIINVTYKTNLGYQLVNWTLNGINVESKYNYIRTINVEYLKTWMYAGQSGGYSVEYDDGKDYQEIGLLYANSDTIEFDLRINILDENGNKLETYLLSENSNGIVALYSIDGADKTAQSKLTVVNDYALTIVPSSHNGYLCYRFDGKDYAIIKMSLSGKSKVFVNKDYSFPTTVFEEGVFKFDSSTLSNLVSYSAGVVISSDNRTIDMNVDVATIFEISAGENSEFAKIQDQKDRNKGSRKLVANTISIASAEQNEMLQGNGNKAYAYYGQKIELWLEANEKYYSGGTIFVDDQDVYSVALQQATEIEITDNVVVVANFVPVTLSYSVTLKYNDNSYYKSNMNEIVNLAGVQILSEYPTYTTINQNNEEVVDVVCDDILRLEFGLDNFNQAIFTDGKLMDYSYLIYVNGTRQQQSDNDIYSWTFDGNIDVTIEIVSNTGNVRVLSNIYEASKIVVATSTGKKQTINQNTVSFDLTSGEKMTIYTKDNVGYRYVGVKFNDGNITTYLRRESTNEDYLGWQTFDLITSYTNNFAGTYEIVYEAQSIDIDLKYAINGEICEDDVAGTGYYTDKDKYVVSDYLTIYKPENGENEGYKFVGYSIQNATTVDVLQGGKSQLTILMSDYADFLNEDEGNYSLTIYINFICQYRISIKLDGNDFGQTDVKLTANSDVLAQSTSASSMPIVTKYLDQSDYSKQKFELKVKSKDTKNYHFVLKVNGEVLTAGDNYIVMKVADTDDVYEGRYIFELNSNLEFTIQYMPRRYTITNTIYEIGDVDTLNKYLAGQEVELTETADSQLKLETKTDSSWANCYGTSNTLIFTITEKEPAYTDFALLHIKINGIIQQVRVSTTEKDGIKTYIYTIDYDIKDDVNIEIVLKRVYGVEIEQ